ncbi:MAG: hypothetical protein H6Q90_6197, partial [Deltaproteobacteria bacterium]|nr:hypothetical protein [Deltaproteobacteria bacterium]
MICVRNGWFVVALAFGFSAPVVADARPVAKKLPAPAASGDDLSLLPVDSEFVGGLDVGQLQQSFLWKQYVEPLLTTDVQKQMTEFKNLCGVDPMKVVTRISFGLKGLTTGAPDGVIVAHGVPKAKLVACFAQISKDKKLGDEVTVDGDVLISNSKDGRPVAFTFVNDSTALIVVGSSATKAGVRTTAKGGTALRTSAAFVDLYKKTKITDTLWILMNGNSKAFDALSQMGVKPKAVFGSINVVQDLQLDMRMRLDSADVAKLLAIQAQGPVTQAAAMFDQLAVASDGADVRVTLALSDAKL